jgi:hypothetical protein
MARITHLLLTRFNVPHARYARDKRGAATCTPEWLAHRFDLFERFCLPSVRGQRGADFDWLVFFDAATPEPFRRRIAAYRDLPRLRPCFATHFDELPERVGAAVPPEAEYLITSRLDNDDALARDALGAVRGAFREQTLEFVNLATGYILARGAVYRARLPRNPFLSLIERRPAGPWRTAWGVAHDRAHEIGPVVDRDERPYWLQVVHDRNLTNAWGDRWDHALQPWRNRMRDALTRSGLLRRREGRIERTRLTLQDLREAFELGDDA